MSKGIAAVLSWLVLVVCPLPVLAAPTIAAGSATVGVGDTFTIQVSISDAQDLSAWQVDLAFDPSIVQRPTRSPKGRSCRALDAFTAGDRQRQRPDHLRPPTRSSIWSPIRRATACWRRSSSRRWPSAPRT
ncbi:MAG: hypothetical protein IPI51_20600 [Betaproteobacteria bacterium]|nr:hypothetical protein [Betaproteobacteria bacterium]